MIKKIKKNELMLFILLLLFIASQVLPKEVDNLDELWNFNFANCIANGLIPYKDFNIIQGPLLPAICAIFLKIFSQEMLVTRILAVILDATILFMVYKIMSNLKIKEYLKYTLIIILAFIMKDYFTIDYNWATLLIILIILNIELKKTNKIEPNFKKDFMLGIIAGLSITFKQTIGIVITGATIGYLIFNIRSQQDFKKYIKVVLYRTLGVVIIIISFLIFLIITGALKYYIDYCVLGIATFSNKISYIKALIKDEDILIRIISLLPITNIISIYLYIRQKDLKMLTLCIFSLINLIFIYPISDKSHFVIAIVSTLISVIYYIYLLAEKIKIPKKEEIIAQCILETFMIVITIYISGYGIHNYLEQNINLELNHFKYLPISQENIEAKKLIINYINSQEKDIVILDATAVYYMIPINKYHKDYDMFLKGNLGSKGEEGQIENLKNLKNTQILILNSKYARNWQNPEKVREYVISQKTKVGEIGIFDIYE